MEADELDLIRRMVAGEESAYRKLLEKHLPPLSNYVIRMMVNTADADDIVQETLIRLWTRGDQFSPEKTKLTTWLHKIAHNLCIDHFRKYRRSIDEHPVQEVALTSGPETSRVQQGLSRDITQAMMALPERQRSAIIMCHYQGLSNKEAAIVLDISVDALESLMARGRGKLRQILAADYED